MRTLTTIFLTLIFGYSSGQEFQYPTIKQNGDSINDFCPAGWAILKSAAGDLNNDKIDDIAFVLQHKDSVIFSKHEVDYNDPPLAHACRVCHK